MTATKIVTTQPPRPAFFYDSCPAKQPGHYRLFEESLVGNTIRTNLQVAGSLPRKCQFVIERVHVEYFDVLSDVVLHLVLDDKPALTLPATLCDWNRGFDLRSFCAPPLVSRDRLRVDVDAFSLPADWHGLEWFRVGLFGYQEPICPPG